MKESNMIWLCINLLTLVILFMNDRELSKSDYKNVKHSRRFNAMVIIFTIVAIVMRVTIIVGGAI